MRKLTTVLFFCFVTAVFAWQWNYDNNGIYERTTTTEPNKPSNLGCFLCSQLLSVTKHRVGLSQNQLRSVLYEKCRVLPVVFKEQCFNFVETSLPEIYFSLNYDFSTKDVCVRLNLCDETNPFAVGGPPPEEQVETEEISSAHFPTVIPTVATPPSTTTPPEPERTTKVPANRDSRDRIGHRNIFVEKETEMKEINEEKRLTCAFCERMLENAKNYAVTSKADITAFANSACANLAKGPLSDQCYQLADKKIGELAKFVDQQVVEALWCAELNQC